MTKYTPSEEYMRYLYGGWAEEFDRFLARVRRDAARQAEAERDEWLDRFLARVRRDAWEEGYDAAADFYDVDVCLAADNPYEETP